MLQNILENISAGNREIVREQLQKLPLAVIPREKSDTLIAFFLNEACKMLNKEIAEDIIQTFELKRMGSDPLPSITMLFLNAEITNETLTFVVKNFPEKQDVDYYIDIINTRNDKEALRAAVNIHKNFPDTTAETWQQLAELSEPEEDDDELYDYKPLLHAFFLACYEETNKDDEKPSWVKNIEEKQIKDIPFTMPSVHQATELIMNDMNARNFKFMSGEKSLLTEDEKLMNDLLIAQYAISTVQEKILMLEPVMKLDNFDDTALFQEYGPVNTMYTFSEGYGDNYICSQYGGCRMFTCTEFEDCGPDGYEFDIMSIHDTEIVPDWYRGTCDHCHKKVKKYHAVRMPLLCGGWKGCYHLKCLEERVSDPITALMVGRIKEQLNVIGIRDR